MVTKDLVRPSRPARTAGLRGWMRRRPVVAFVALAYALSWLVWIPAGFLGGGRAVLVVGAFGPPVAAWIVLRATGGSVRVWARQMLRWRVRPRYYLYALGLPALLLTVDVTIGATLLTATLVLIAATRGRLGYPTTPATAGRDR